MISDPDAVLECAVREINFVAHPDDDLLFMNPDVARSIQAEHCVTTVYLTAGDDGQDESYWARREAGVQAAYALLAGVDNAWSQSDRTYGSHAVRSYFLDDAPNVSLAFLSIPDGIDGAGSSRYHGASLRRLWRAELPELTTVDERNRFDREALITVLAAMMERADATKVRSLDRSGAYGRDHSDHRNAARFVLAAYERRTAMSGTSLTMYRGYNISQEAPDLDAAEARDKWTAFMTYAAFDDKLGRGRDHVIEAIYAPWATREYALPENEPVASSILGFMGGCLGLEDEAGAGPRARLAPCADLPGQSWLLTRNGQLRSAGWCLEGGDGAATSGAAVHATICRDGPRQRWLLTDDGHLTALGKCLAASGGDRASAGFLEIADCADAPEQRWRLGS